MTLYSYNMSMFCYVPLHLLITIIFTIDYLTIILTSTETIRKEVTPIEIQAIFDL